MARAMKISCNEIEFGIYSSGIIRDELTGYRPEVTNNISQTSYIQLFNSLLWKLALQSPHLNQHMFSLILDPSNPRHLLELTGFWCVAAGPVPVSPRCRRAWSCSISHTSSPKWRQPALIPNILSKNMTPLICTFFVSTFAAYLGDLRDQIFLQVLFRRKFWHSPPPVHQTTRRQSFISEK